jgi:O-antigen/teichoic acid export membrane protein
MLVRLASRRGPLAILDQAILSGTSFLTTVLIGRAAGPEELGLYSLGFTLSVLILIVQESLVAAPYTVFAQRLHGAARAEYAGSALAHHGMLAILAAAALIVAAVAVGAGGLGPVLGVLAVAVPFALLRDFGRRLCFAHGRMRAALVLDAATSLLQMLGLVAVMAGGWATAVAAQAVVGVACAVTAVGWLVAARADFAWRRETVAAELRRSWAFGKWVTAGQVVATVHGFALYWLLALVEGPTATGALVACMQLVMLSNPFLLGLSNALGPVAARAYADGGPAAVRGVATRAALVLGAGMGAFAVAVVVLGGVAMERLYGAEYAGQEPILAVLAAALLAGGFSVAADHGLRALARPDVGFRASAIGLCVTVLTASVLLMHFGVLGAACGFLAGCATGSVVRWLAFRRLAAEPTAEVARAA